LTAAADDAESEDIATAKEGEEDDDEVALAKAEEAAAVAKSQLPVIDISANVSGGYDNYSVPIVSPAALSPSNSPSLHMQVFAYCGRNLCFEANRSKIQVSVLVVFMLVMVLLNVAVKFVPGVEQGEDTSLGKSFFKGFYYISQKKISNINLFLFSLYIYLSSVYPAGNVASSYAVKAMLLMVSRLHIQ